MSKAQNEALGAKPTATVPASKASKLGTKDLIEGSGPAAKVGDLLQMRYLGVSQNSKKEFDSSWSRGSGATSYLPVELGAGRVIPGWEQGLVGMKVGGRRELVIPADLAYGKNPPSNDIAVDDTLVFVVDLMSLEPRSPATTIATPTVPAPPSVTVPASSASVTTGSTTTAG